MSLLEGCAGKPFAQLSELQKLALSMAPETAYEALFATQVLRPYFPMNPLTPRKEGFVRFVAISDTHNAMGKFALPEGDVLLHCGDFTNGGRPDEIHKFVNEFAKTNFRHRIGSCRCRFPLSFLLQLGSLMLFCFVLQ